VQPIGFAKFIFNRGICRVISSNLVYDVPVSSPDRNGDTINFDHFGCVRINFVDGYYERPVNSFKKF
jgi:hypothetical protein